VSAFCWHSDRLSHWSCDAQARVWDCKHFWQCKSSRGFQSHSHWYRCDCRRRLCDTDASKHFAVRLPDCVDVVWAQMNGTVSAFAHTLPTSGDGVLAVQWIRPLFDGQFTILTNASSVNTVVWVRRDESNHTVTQSVTISFWNSTVLVPTPPQPPQPLTPSGILAHAALTFLAVAVCVPVGIAAVRFVSRPKRDKISKDNEAVTHCCNGIQLNAAM
jgi:WD40 repeat protein